MDVSVGMVVDRARLLGVEVLSAPTSDARFPERRARFACRRAHPSRTLAAPCRRGRCGRLPQGPSPGVPPVPLRRPPCPFGLAPVRGPRPVRPGRGRRGRPVHAAARLLRPAGTLGVRRAQRLARRQGLPGHPRPQRTGARQLRLGVRFLLPPHRLHEEHAGGRSGDLLPDKARRSRSGDHPHVRGVEPRGVVARGPALPGGVRRLSHLHLPDHRACVPVPASAISCTWSCCATTVH